MSAGSVVTRIPDPRLVVAAVLAVTAAQLVDLATFAGMVSAHGPAVEANPLVAWLLIDRGLQFVAVTKIAGLSVVVAIIVVLAGRETRPHHRRLAISIAALAILAGLVGGWTNVAVIL
jgi:hypothetical protein